MAVLIICPILLPILSLSFAGACCVVIMLVVARLVSSHPIKLNEQYRPRPMLINVVVVGGKARNKNEKLQKTVRPGV